MRRLSMWMGLMFAGVAHAAPVVDATPLYAGRDEVVVVRGAPPGASVALLLSTRGPGTGPCASPAGPCSGLRRPSLVGRTLADAAGEARFTVRLERLLPAQTWWLQAAVLGTAPELSPVVAAAVVPWSTDTDGDGAVDVVELMRGLDPQVPDTDGDGQLDGVDPLPLVASPVDRFVPDDVQVTTSGSSVRDPEFDPERQRIVWQERDGATLWVADVRHADGAIRPADGRGTLVDTDVAPMSVARNGPEWVSTARGAEALYLKDVGGTWVIHRAADATGTWVAGPLPGWPEGSLVSGSKDEADPFPRITLAREVGGARQRGYRALDLPGTERLLGTRWTVLRFVQGEPTLVGLRLVSDDVDVHLIDGASGVDTVLPLTGGVAWDVWAGASAAWGGDRLVLVARGARSAAPTELAVWREQGGVWTLAKVIQPPAGLPFVVSPEPFVVGGITYASFLATQLPQAEGSADSEVWMVALDDPSPRLRRVSAATPSVRKDPEPYTGGAEPWVYYTEDTAQGPVLRRTTLGL